MIASTCEHEWFAWARGRRTPALHSIYCGRCRVVVDSYLAELRAENERLRRHLAEEHGCVDFDEERG